MTDGRINDVRLILKRYLSYMSTTVETTRRIYASYAREMLGMQHGRIIT